MKLSELCEKLSLTVVAGENNLDTAFIFSSLPAVTVRDSFSQSSERFMVIPHFHLHPSQICSFRP